MIDKKVLEESAWELYRLEIQKRQVETKIDDLREKVLSQMNMLHQDKFITDDFTIEKTASVKYGTPTPDQLYEVLGKAADKYIVKVVDPKVRLDLPPQVSARLCPIIRETEYVRTKLRVANANNSNSK